MTLNIIVHCSTRDSSTEIFHDYTWVDCPYTSLKFPSPHSSKYSQRLRFFPRISLMIICAHHYTALVSYLHPKSSNHLRSHLRAIMALHHGKLGLENKSGRIFCVRQVYFTKSCQKIWGRVNQPFILFIHQIWGETLLWGAVFIIETSDRMQYLTIPQYKLHSFNIQDDRSTRGL